MKLKRYNYFINESHEFNVNLPSSEEIDNYFLPLVDDGFNAEITGYVLLNDNRLIQTTFDNERNLPVIGYRLSICYNDLKNIANVENLLEDNIFFNIISDYKNCCVYLNNLKSMSKYTDTATGGRFGVYLIDIKYEKIFSKRNNLLVKYVI